MRFVKAIVVSSIVILGISGSVYFVARNSSRTVSSAKNGSIKGFVVSKAQVDSIVSQDSGVTSKSAAELILQNKLLVLIAADLKLDPSKYQKGSLDELIPLYGLNVETSHESFYLSSYNNRLKDAIIAVLTPGISGRFIIAHFDQNIEVAGADQNITFASLSEKAKKDLLFKDKAYALNFIQDLYAKLVSGSTTFDQAIALERTNKYLGTAQISTLTQSGSFDTATEYKTAEVKLSLAPNVLAELKKTKVGKWTGVLTQQVPTAEKSTSNMVDGFYSVYLVDKVVPGNSAYTTFDQILEAYKIKYQYREPQK